METITSIRSTASIVTEGGSPYANAYLLTLAGVVDSNAFGLPIIKTSSFKDDTESKETEDENGNTYGIAGGKRTATFELTHIQQDTDAITFYDDWKNKPFLIIKEMHEVAINGKMQYRIMPFCKIQPKYDNTSPGIETKYEFKCEQLPAELKVDLTALDTDFNITLTCTCYTIPKGTVSVIYEETVV